MSSSRYVILEPVVYKDGNKVVSVPRPGPAAVRIDDDVAKELGDKVRRVDSGGPADEPEKAAPAKVESKPKAGDKNSDTVANPSPKP